MHLKTQIKVAQSQEFKPFCSVLRAMSNVITVDKCVHVPEMQKNVHLWKDGLLNYKQPLLTVNNVSSKSCFLNTVVDSHCIRCCTKELEISSKYLFILLFF